MDNVFAPILVLFRIVIPLLIHRFRAKIDIFFAIMSGSSRIGRNNESPRTGLAPSGWPAEYGKSRTNEMALISF
jgi:hypothetical protein